jgi:hypothetical protein
MLVSSLLSNINNNLRGQDDVTPDITSDEGIYWLATINQKKDELYEDLTKQWSFSFHESFPNEPGTVATAGTTALTGTNTYFTDYAVGDKIVVSGETVRTIDTITSDTALTVTAAFSNTASGKTFTHDIIIRTGVQTYNLHRRFLGASDTVYVTNTDGNRIEYSVIQPQERQLNFREAFISEENPLTITFTTNIESTEDIIGGVLTVPGYSNVPDMTAATDVVPMPDPNWLALAVAADLAFGDLIYEDKTEGLNVRANNLYSMMVRKNRRGTFRNARKLQTTNSYRIHGPTTRSSRSI